MRYIAFLLLFSYFILNPNPSYSSSPAPLLKIISPENNQTILGSVVTISFLIGNAVMGKDVRLYLWIDSNSFSHKSATEITSRFDHVISGLSQGRHTLTLELLSPQYESFRPPLVKTVSFIIQYPQEKKQSVSNATGQVQSRSQDRRRMLGFFIGIGLLVTGMFFMIFRKKRSEFDI